MAPRSGGSTGDRFGRPMNWWMRDCFEQQRIVPTLIWHVDVELIELSQVSFQGCTCRSARGPVRSKVPRQPFPRYLSDGKAHLPESPVAGVSGQGKATLNEQTHGERDSTLLALLQGNQWVKTID